MIREFIISVDVNAGMSGVSGFAGAGGNSGYSGVIGNSGISGYSGVKGDIGLNISGYSGVSGYSGEKGNTGTQGIQGLSGVSGVSGYSGVKGISGAVGSQGDTGIVGQLGYSGLKGVSGSVGSIGGSGVSGTSGYSGLRGDSGGVGSTGSSGASGTSGYSGLKGDSGSVGSTGSSGVSGTSGYSGFKGNTGSTGSAGTSGYSGISGTNKIIKRDIQGDIVFDRNGVSFSEWSHYTRLVGITAPITAQAAYITLDQNNLHFVKIPPMRIKIKGSCFPVTGGEASIGVLVRGFINYLTDTLGNANTTIYYPASIFSQTYTISTTITNVFNGMVAAGFSASGAGNPPTSFTIVGTVQSTRASISAISVLPVGFGTVNAMLYDGTMVVKKV